MPETPAVTAVVVAYNGGRDLHACVESLLAQTIDLEIIVVDNASTDGSVEGLEVAFGSRIRVLRRSSNGGYAAGANTGWRAATTPVVAILNQDVVLERDCLNMMRMALLAEPRDALVTPKLVLSSDPSKVNAVGNDVHLSGVAWTRGLGTAADDWHGVKEVTAVSGAAILTSHAFLVRIGGLDERYFMYVEDVDLSLRTRIAGGTCLAACDAVVRHTWTLRLTPAKFGLLERNWAALWKRFMGRARGVWLARAQADAMGWLYAATHGRAYLRAKWDARRCPLEIQPIDPPPTHLLSLLAWQYPYDIVFPYRPVLARVGRAIDRFALLCQKVLALPGAE